MLTDIRSTTPKAVARYLVFVSSLGALALLGTVAGRALSPSEPPSAPALGDLRSPPTFEVIPALRFKSFSDLADYADTVAVVRVDEVDAVKDTEVNEDITGNEAAFGHANVNAAVTEQIKGDSTSAAKFAFDAFFNPDGQGLAVSASVPPLQAGRTYLVFIHQGRLIYPGGIYALADGKVWYIGWWTGASDRSYPGPLSGLTIPEAAKVIQEASQR